MNDSLLEQAEKVEITALDDTTLGGEIAEGVSETGAVNWAAENILFAEPNEINTISDFFGLDNKELLESEKLDDLKFIYKESQKYDYNLDGFLNEVSRRIGGKFSENILPKMFQYLSLLAREDESIKGLVDIKNGLRKLENESSNNL